MPPSPDAASSVQARMRCVAESLFARSTSGQQRPLKADHGAAVNSPARRPGCTSGRQGDQLPSSRPAISARQQVTSNLPGSAATRGNLLAGVRHSGSVPAINRMNEGDPTAGFLDYQSRRTVASSATRYPGSVTTPSGGQSVYDRHDANQSNSAAECRVRGRGYFRDNGGGVSSLRQPPAPTPSDHRSQIPQIGPPANRAPWK